MKENVDFNSLNENSIHHQKADAKHDRIFELVKMNMNEQQVELVVRIRELQGNHFKVEYEHGMVTIKAISDYLHPRMVTTSYILPCMVNQDSTQTQKNGNTLIVRFERKSAENYLFDWRALKDQNTGRN